jgi:hypothetical protein
MLTTTSAQRLAAWADENLHPFGGIALVGIGATTYLALLAWAWQHTSYDVWGAILIAPVLVALTIPIARRVAHDENESSMVRIIMSALAVKLLMALVRYAVAFGVYGGYADSAVYHEAGAELAKHYRVGDFQFLNAGSSGTGFIKVVTGFVYTITGPTMIGGFLIFSWLGFWGLYLLYRAFRVALPEGDHKRYAKLVFFLPSMTFWPSSTGKEAWMCLMLGLAAYGTARMIAHRRGAFAYIALGVAGGTFVRPHVILIFFVSVVIAYILGQRRRGGWFGPVPKVLGILLLTVACVFLLDRVQSYFEVTDLEGGGTTQVLEIAQSRSDKGGSQYKTVTPTSPGRFAFAVVTVLFRPFPQEAGNFQTVLAALEGTFVLLLTLWSAHRALYLFRSPRRASYGWMCLTYTLIFCYAFARIGNFGILTRQRVQVLPFLLVLLCLPPRTSMVEQTPSLATDGR